MGESYMERNDGNPGLRDHGYRNLRGFCLKVFLLKIRIRY